MHTTRGSTRSSDESVTRHNAVLVLVDYQVAPLWEAETLGLRRDGLCLARGAHLLEVPTVLTGIASGVWGPVVAELTEACPGAQTVERCVANPWDELGFRDAIESTGRSHVILAGTMVECGVRYAALAAVRAGYTVHVVIDACGHFSDREAATAVLWMVRGGVRLTGVGSLLASLGRDELEPATCDALALALRHPLPDTAWQLREQVGAGAASTR